MVSPARPYIHTQTFLRFENNSKGSLSSISFLVCSALWISDGLTSIIGLSEGLQETEAFAGFLLANFGEPGFLVFKFSIALLIAATAILYGERLEKHSEFSRLFYFCVSVSLLFAAALPVINNMILLGWL